MNEKVNCVSRKYFVVGFYLKNNTSFYFSLKHNTTPVKIFRLLGYEGPGFFGRQIEG